MRQALALTVLLAVAGCSQPAPSGDGPAPGPMVEGWVIDEALRPLAGANVTLAGLGQSALADGEGHYALEVPAGVDLLLTATAAGHRPASAAVSAASGAHHVVNFTLERVPEEAPFDVLEDFNGVLRCGVTAVVMEDQATPHEHQGVRCSTVLNDTRNVWRTGIPPNATGMVMEAQWEPNSELAQGLVMKIVVDGTGEVLGFLEGRSILRVQLSQAKLAQNIAAGYTTFTVTIEAGAGTGEHEHGAIGVFHEQAFTLYKTSFFNGPPDPAYSVATRPA